jgi:hypothetical protein
MRVIGAGFGRTGTTSLKAALEKLGFGPTYSLGEVFRNPEHVGFWEAASSPAGEEMDWGGSSQASPRRCSSSDASQGHGSVDAARGSVIGEVQVSSRRDA